MDDVTPRGWRAFSAAVAVVYGLLLWHFHWLRFPLDRDEGHFWPTSLQFSGHLSLHLLRGYHELNTPLSFLIFGRFQAWTGHGLFLARALDLVLSIAVLAAIAAVGRARTPALLCAAGLALCPYYLGLATHMYGDMLAVALVVAGAALFFRQRWAWAALAWSLAIATRQTMVAFPAAFAAYAAFQHRGRLSPAIVWPLAAVATLAGWFALFHGLAPNAGDAPHPLQPQNVLYLLTCLGLYFVVPESLLLSPARQRWRELFRHHRTRIAAFAVALILVFVLFPPLGNTLGTIPGMGLFDAIMRAHLSAPPRIAAYALLALAACLRFARPHNALAAWLIAANASIALLDPVAWEKYTLPLLAVLWYLEARPAPELPLCPEPPSSLEPAPLASPPLSSC